MQITFSVATELTTVTCGACGGVYAISTIFENECRQKGNFQRCWTCPYCKVERGYGESVEQKERARLNAVIEELKRSTERESQRRADAEKEAEHFRKSRDGMKGVLAKERKRVGNGVCPCCNRTFGNLQKHMATKHPEHANADILNND